MQDELIQQLEDQYINAPLELEKEMDDLARYAAGQLTWGNRQKASIEFMDSEYVFSYLTSVSEGKTVIRIIAVRGKNEAEADNGRIFHVEVERDSSLTEFENIKYGIKALLQHVAGVIEPEVLED